MCDVMKNLRDGFIFFFVNKRYFICINMMRWCVYLVFVFNILNINVCVCREREILLSKEGNKVIDII